MANPNLAMLMAMAQAMGPLCEQVVYDAESGQPVAGSLMDYAAPRADILGFSFVTEMDQATPCRNRP